MNRALTSAAKAHRIASGLEDSAGTGTRTGQRWYAINTKPHCETSALSQLERQGYECFLPLTLRTVRHARRLHTSRAALFTGYLFVRLDRSQDRWRPINNTFGVRAIVMGNCEPLPVPHGIVECLQDLTADDGLMRLDSLLDAGDRIKMLAGPFAGSIGTLERLDGKARARCLLDIMGGQVIVDIDTSAVIGSN